MPASSPEPVQAPAFSHGETPADTAVLSRRDRRRARRAARRENKRKGLSVRLKIAATFTGFTFILILILNIYPILVSRDMVFSTKESSMTAQSSVISSSLSALETLTEDSVKQVMAILDITEATRIIVTDSSGLILYDTSEDSDTSGRYALLSEVSIALTGEVKFYSSYADGVFISRAATPVVSSGGIIGAVYLYEYDANQGQIIRGLQRNLMQISILFAFVGILIISLLATTLTRRIKKLSAAMGIVRSGDYSYRLKVTGRDELAELSSEFNVLTGRLESTEEIRRRFVSDASHELRTPLAAIRLLSDSITQSRNMDKSTMQEFVADIGNEAERLQRITEKLMSLTKLDAGIRTAVPEPSDLQAAANRTLHLLAPLAAKQRVSIVTELAPNCMVLASSDDLYQIIFNLVENGIKYNVSGGKVMLSLRRTRSQAILTVTDTGIGIPEADREHIFDRFYRVDKARSRASGGSGLGLAIVHDTVLANGGTIDVSCPPAGGTCFTVTFPLYRKKEHRS